jgi:hypothetical protein
VRVDSANLEMAVNATTALAAKAKASTARRMTIVGRLPTAFSAV